jgi:hypothetical protein
MTAPIALFAFKRLEHLKITLESLVKNKEAARTPLIIFCDAARNDDEKVAVDTVRKYIETISGFKSIKKVYREKNIGLANSIISGVTDVLNEYDSVIVIEDDLETSPYFLKYMNEALELYKHDYQVASIHGYIYPVPTALPETFFIRGADCWGWATWKRAWTFFESDGQKLLTRLSNENLEDKFDMHGGYPYIKMLEQQIEGKNNSWAIRWHASCFINNFLTLYPGKSLVNNIGLDNSGTHCPETDIYNQEISHLPVSLKRLPIKENESARKQIELFLRTSNKSTLKQKFKSLMLKIKSLTLSIR